jgi:HSP90 family molecular chaperone
MRRMMTMVESGRAPALPPQTLEINGGHPIIVALAAARKVEPEMASKVASQLFANALIAAGLLDDPRTMLPNVNALLLDLVRPYATAATAASAATAKAD